MHVPVARSGGQARLDLVGQQRQHEPAQAGAATDADRGRAGARGGRARQRAHASSAAARSGAIGRAAVSGVGVASTGRLRGRRPGERRAAETGQGHRRPVQPAPALRPRRFGAATSFGLAELGGHFGRAVALGLERVGMVGRRSGHAAALERLARQHARRRRARADQPEQEAGPSSGVERGVGQRVDQVDRQRVGAAAARLLRRLGREEGGGEGRQRSPAPRFDHSSRRRHPPPARLHPQAGQGAHGLWRAESSHRVAALVGRFAPRRRCAIRPFALGRHRVVR